MYRMMRILVAAAFVCSLWPVSGVAQSEHQVRQLRAALHEMHDWLGEDQRGTSWKEHLRSGVLAEQIGQLNDLDRSVLTEIREIYAAETPGLDRAQFQAVREALVELLESLPQEPVERLPQLVRTAGNRFVSVTPDQLASSKLRINQTLAALDGYFSPASDDIIRRWKEYLKWSQLQSELEAPNPSLRNLQRIRRVYFADFNGLDLEVFTDVRTSLTDYMNLLVLSRQQNAEELYKKRIEDLAKLIEQDRVMESNPDRIVLGRTLGWLQNSRQVPELVKSIRQHYWQPNLFASISERLVGVGFASEVDETSDVNEFILGTSIYGTARMTGNLSLNLVPNDQRATLEILLSGNVVSDNVGYNGPVTVFSNGYSDVLATKLIEIDDQGLTGKPAVANCATSTNITSIAARLNLVRRIAWRKAARSKAQTEGIASARTEQKIASRVDEQAREMLEKAQSKFVDKIKKPLIRRDSFPNSVQFRTTDDQLTVTALHASRFQVGAPSLPPKLDVGLDLSVRVHETIAGNFAETLLGGETVTNERVAELLNDLGIEVPPELAGEDDDWSITFAADRPLVTRFQQNRIHLAIRGQRFTRGDQEIRSPIEITTTYEIQRAGTGARLSRVGDVVVQYINQRSLSVGKVAMKTFLQKRFDGLFKESVVSDGLKMPGNWESAGVLQLRDLECDGGWWSLGWTIPDPAIRTADASSGP